MRILSSRPAAVTALRSCAGSLVKVELDHDLLQAVQTVHSNRADRSDRHAEPCGDLGVGARRIVEKESGQKPATPRRERIDYLLDLLPSHDLFEPFLGGRGRVDQVRRDLGVPGPKRPPRSSSSPVVALVPRDRTDPGSLLTRPSVKALRAQTGSARPRTGRWRGLDARSSPAHLPQELSPATILARWANPVDSF